MCNALYHHRSQLSDHSAHVLSAREGSVEGKSVSHVTFWGISVKKLKEGVNWAEREGEK